MLLPRLFEEELFDDMMDWNPKPMFGKHEKNWMKTDIKDMGENYELDMDLPGFKKEDVQIQLENGYLTISAKKDHSVDDKDEKGNYIRQERYYGSCSRSFYVGENVKHEDVKAKFEDGILRLSLPKEAPKVENKNYIAIE
ncbi:MAG: Hsp20/alpha crystallin family protein [Traorella sp.]